MEERGEAQSGSAAAQQSSQSPPFSLPPSTIPSSSNSLSLSNPNPNPSISSNSSLHPFQRPWEPHTQYRHFSTNSVLNSQSQSSSGMAIGVPSPHMAPAPFSSLNPNSFANRFARPPESQPPNTSTTPQARLPIQGNQGIGMRGPISSSPPMRAGGVAMHHQQRPVQSSIRPQTTLSNQSSTSQNMQVHGMSRGPAVGSPGSPLPVSSQGLQSHNQPWLSSGASPRPPLPNAPFRAQMSHPQSLQQRSHIPQLHHHTVSMPSQRPQPPSSSQHLQHSSSSEVTQESLGQQIPVPRLSQQQILKTPGIGNQKPVANSASQPSTVSAGISDKTTSSEIVETCNKIISKRSIQELVAQIDPSEKLDPEVEDILVGIAEDFVESAMENTDVPSTRMDIDHEDSLEIVNFGDDGSDGSPHGVLQDAPQEVDSRKRGRESEGDSEDAPNPKKRLSLEIPDMTRGINPELHEMGLSVFEGVPVAEVKYKLRDMCLLVASAITHDSSADAALQAALKERDELKEQVDNHRSELCHAQRYMAEADRRAAEARNETEEVRKEKEEARAMAEEAKAKANGVRRATRDAMNAKFTDVIRMAEEKQNAKAFNTHLAVLRQAGVDCHNAAWGSFKWPYHGRAPFVIGPDFDWSRAKVIPIPSSKPSSSAAPSSSAQTKPPPSPQA